VVYLSAGSTSTVTGYAAVSFDLDGTLCRPLQSEGELYDGAFDAAGVDRFGDPTELWAALDGDPPPHDDESYLATGFESVALAHGRSDAPVRELARGFLDAVDYSKVAFRPGARDALARARRHGPVGLVTNGPERRQAVKLDALGIADAFDAVVYAGDMSNRKPHRDPFDRAVAALDVPASDAVHVGDSLEYDVAGALGAGLAAAWVPSEEARAPDDYRPDHVLRSLEDFPALLD
jgi:putative hydrolase of the HAD superfamily